MDILLISPVSRTSPKGNRRTADRWEELLTALGHRVTVATEFTQLDPDLGIFLHARRSHDPLRKFKLEHPDRPAILALTGTDLYRDIHQTKQARKSLELADHFVVFQSRGPEELPEELRSRTSVIYQSVKPPAEIPEPKTEVFEVSVIGHLREVKDPFRTAEAVRDLPDSSRIEVVHMGMELEVGMATQAEQYSAELNRYNWLGLVPRDRALRILARSRVMVISSILEGGAHVVSEAIACKTPVLASEIPGNIGILGDDYPGYFPVRDPETLRELLLRTESEDDFYQQLNNQVESLSDLVRPERERTSWETLLKNLS